MNIKDIDNDNSDVVRITAKKHDGYLQPEYKKLCVNPFLTTYEILRHLLAHAFNISGDFCISYLSKDEKGHDTYLTLLSDWDLDTAFHSASKPNLILKVDLKPFEDSLEDWDIVGLVGSPPTNKVQGFKSTVLMSAVKGSIANHVGKTVNQVGKAMGLKSAESSPQNNVIPPLTDTEFKEYLDNVGHLTEGHAFRLRVFQSGVEQVLRKVAWRHLLNIYPEDMNGRERFNYLKRKGEEYLKLRQEWMNVVASNSIPEEVRYVCSMVRKDVLRTDRQHDFFLGSDDGPNLKALNNLLVTYALTHPSLSYCQGMSDLAATILIVQEDEANAYVCFCGLMQRMRANFELDGETMRLKFHHLQLLLQHYDPAFFAWLKLSAADDLLYCYRWLLLELKREFPLDDALHLFEVVWSSIPPAPPEDDMKLFENNYREHWFEKPVKPGAALVSTRLQRLRSRSQSSSSSSGVVGVTSVHQSSNAIELNNLVTKPGNVDSIDDNKRLLTNPVLVTSNSWSESSISSQCKTTESQIKITSQSSSSLEVMQQREHDKTSQQASCKLAAKSTLTSSPNSAAADNLLILQSDQVDNFNLFSDEDHLVSNTRSKIDRSNQDVFANDDDDDDFCKPLLEQCGAEPAEGPEYSSIEFVVAGNQLPMLPPPDELGCGNPFLLFICLAMLLQQRDKLMQSRKLEYDEIAMTFDKMVRKHQVNLVLDHARSIYAAYLRSQQQTAVSDAGGDC